MTGNLVVLLVLIAFGYAEGYLIYKGKKTKREDIYQTISNRVWTILPSWLDMIIFLTIEGGIILLLICCNLWGWLGAIMSALNAHLFFPGREYFGKK